MLQFSCYQLKISIMKTRNNHIIIKNFPKVDTPPKERLVVFCRVAQSIYSLAITSILAANLKYNNSKNLDLSNRILVATASCAAIIGFSMLLKIEQLICNYYKHQS